MQELETYVVVALCVTDPLDQHLPEDIVCILLELETTKVENLFLRDLSLNLSVKI